VGRQEVRKEEDHNRSETSLVFSQGAKEVVVIHTIGCENSAGKRQKVKFQT